MGVFNRCSSNVDTGTSLKEVVKMPVVIKYRLAWFSSEARGEVQLYVNDDAKPDLTIKVQSASELVAWDTLLGQRGMKKADKAEGGPVVFTEPKQIT